MFLFRGNKGAKGANKAPNAPDSGVFQRYVLYAVNKSCHCSVALATTS